MLFATALASADTIGTGSWAQNGSKGRNDTAALAMARLADDTVAAPLNGQLLSVPGMAYSPCSNAAPTCAGHMTLLDLPSVDFASGVNTRTYQVPQAGGYEFGVDFLGSVSTVPEPSSLFLLGSGLVGSAGILLRRKRA